MRKKVVIALFVVAIFWFSAGTNGEVWRFDFGRQGDTPASGYIHVDSTTTYGYDTDTGWTYGVVGTVIDEDYWGAWWSRNTADELALNGLRFDNDGGGVSGFELEVPNGEYLVTIGAGNAGWNITGKIYAEGGFYSATVNSDNLYILDVNPDKLPPDDPTYPNEPDGYLTWTLSQDYEQHGVLYYGQIPTWGMNNQNPDYYMAAELLYLKNQPITVTDGKLTVFGHGGSQVYTLLNFLEVVPNTCQGIIEAGYGLKGDLSSDCQIEVTDFALFAAKWQMCNDPADPNCSPKW